MRHFAMCVRPARARAHVANVKQVPTLLPAASAWPRMKLTWSNSDAPDTITTRSEGPSCAQAAVVFVARNAEWRSVVDVCVYLFRS